MSRPHRRWQKWLLFGSSLLVCDILAARQLLRWRPNVDLPREEARRLARLEHEETERRYRVESDVYDHDLVARFDGIGWWGPLRYRIRTNSLGFKDATTRTVPLKTDRRRVLLIGDSFTEGLGFQFSDTFAGMIANELDGRGVEVLNAAVTSYSPAIYFAKVRHLTEDVGLAFTDLVVFMDISDIEDEARFYDLHTDGRVTRMVDMQPGRGPEYGDTRGEEHDAKTAPVALPSNRPASPAGVTPAAGAVPAATRADVRPHTPPAAWRLFLKRHSILVRAIDLMNERWRGNDTAESVTYPQGDPRRSWWTFSEADFNAYGRTGLLRAARHMDRLAALVRGRNISLTVAVYPWPEQVRYDGADSIQVTYWREWAANHGVLFIDLFAPFFDDPNREATIRTNFIPGDVHFSTAGSRMVARGFLAKFR